MNFERFDVYTSSLLKGCMNRIGDMHKYSDRDEYDWYGEAHNELSGTLMSLQAEYYDDE